MNNSQLSEIQMLDNVLDWFAMDAKDFKGALIPRLRAFRDEAHKNISETIPGMNTIEFNELSELIFYKLERDGYIKIISDKDKSNPSFSVTYDGKLFSRYGGYQNKEHTNAKIENRKDRRELMLIVGTFLAGIGALALVFWEVYKTFYLHLD